MSARRLSAGLATTLLGLGLGGCPTSSVTSCQESLMCRGTQVQICCSTTACEYLFMGSTVPCAGTDCSAAAAQILALCPCVDAGPSVDASTDGALLDASGCVR